MKNMNKNLIFISLILLAILALVAIMLPSRAHAEYAHYNFNTKAPEPAFVYPAPTYSAPTPPVFTPTYSPLYQAPQPQPEPVVYYQNNPYGNAPQATTTATTVSNNSDTSSVYTESRTNVTTDDYSNVAANSFFGRFSFMPSGLIQWILIAIFILVIVITVRKVTGKDEEFHSAPLKHA